MEKSIPYKTVRFHHTSFLKPQKERYERKPRYESQPRFESKPRNEYQPRFESKPRYESKPHDNQLRLDLAKFELAANTLEQNESAFWEDVKQFKTDVIKFKTDVLQSKLHEDALHQQIDALTIQNAQIVDELVNKESKLSSAEHMATHMITGAIGFIAGDREISQSALKNLAITSLNALGPSRLFNTTSHITPISVIKMAMAVKCLNCNSNSHVCALGSIICKYCKNCLTHLIEPSINILGNERSTEIIKRSIKHARRFCPSYYQAL